MLPILHESSIDIDSQVSAYKWNRSRQDSRLFNIGERRGGDCSQIPAPRERSASGDEWYNRMTRLCGDATK
jgi:N6-adenosine-specific RNA methylase IME4